MAEKSILGLPVEMVDNILSHVSLNPVRRYLPAPKTLILRFPALYRITLGCLNPRNPL